MSKQRNRRPPMTVAEAEAALERARRREAAQSSNLADALGQGHGHYRRVDYREHVDLETLDTPDVSHADQWAAFLNRPGRFYVATLDIPGDDDAMGLKVCARTTLKADDQQLPYLVEVLRQVRGAFGEHCRITLTPADVANAETGPPLPDARVEVNRDATPDELAAVRAMRRRQAERIAEPLPTIPDGPPYVPGVDMHLGERRDASTPPGPPWYPASDREFTKEQLVEMLPGQTRSEVAEELGKPPEAIGGSVHHADVMPEELAAELGVPVESLTRIPITGGGYAWTIKPPAAPQPGRHAAPDI